MASPSKTVSQPARLPNQQPMPLPADFLQSQVRSEGSNVPDRIVLHGVEGFGKTSFAAQCPSPLFLMAKGETGLETLINSGRLPATPHLPELQTWEAYLQALEALRTQPHDFRTIALDAGGGFERLCHEYVCKTEFNGDWSDSGFLGYMRGYEVSLSEWRNSLNLLDRIREERRCAIVLLAHTKVKTFKNPDGADFDRYSVDMHDKTWSLTHKWADMVLFGTFYIDTKEDKQTKRHKGIGGEERVLYTERRASFDAKNRHGLPESIDMGSSPAEAFANFKAALREAKQAATVAEAVAS